MKVIAPFVDHANKALGLNYRIDTSEIPQFTIYEVGQYYGWHQDQWPKPYSQDHNIPKFRGKNRKLSSTILMYLNKSMKSINKNCLQKMSFINTYFIY